MVKVTLPASVATFKDGTLTVSDATLVSFDGNNIVVLVNTAEDKAAALAAATPAKVTRVSRKATEAAPEPVAAAPAKAATPAAVKPAVSKPAAVAAKPAAAVAAKPAKAKPAADVVEELE